MLANPFPQLMDGAGSAEAPPLLTTLKKDHGRKSSQTVVAGELHVIRLIDLDLGQAESACILGNDPLQVRREGMTGGTPIRPEIHQDRVAVRRIDDVRLKTGVIDGEDKGFRVSGVHREKYQRTLIYVQFYQGHETGRKEKPDVRRASRNRPVPPRGIAYSPDWLL